MNLHEYQAKDLFRSFNIPCSTGTTITKTHEIADAIKQLKGNKWIIKAQVHAGGRGKAGGVKLIESVDEAQEFTESLLGKNLVTYQTDKNGQQVNTILIEEVCNISSEFYLSMLVDRGSESIAIISSTEGGMEIEEVSRNTPEKIITTRINPAIGIMPYQVRKIFTTLGLEGKDLYRELQSMLVNMITMFKQNDLSLLEVNPLVLTKENNLLCLDGKVSVDSNALYRQKELEKKHDLTQEDEREIDAESFELNYVALDGNVGCMVNGAGLAMATMDLIKLHGGDPANFLDVGGGATVERVTKALEIILSDKNVKSILINILGGIVRCDIIADGIIEALKKIQTDVKFVVRLEGNNAELGLKKLEDEDLDILVAKDLTKATKLAIESAAL